MQNDKERKEANEPKASLKQEKRENFSHLKEVKMCMITSLVVILSAMSIIIFL